MLNIVTICVNTSMHKILIVKIKCELPSAVTERTEQNGALPGTLDTGRSREPAKIRS